MTGKTAKVYHVFADNKDSYFTELQDAVDQFLAYVLAGEKHVRLYATINDQEDCLLALGELPN
jgi:hypothetical protein